MLSNPPIWLIALAARLVSFADLLLPKSRRIVYVSQPDVSDNPLGLFLAHARTNPDLDAVWLIRGDIAAAKRRLQALLGDLPFQRYRLVQKNTLAGLLAVLCSRVICSSHTTYRFLWSSHRRISLSLWHGMPLKCIGRMDGKDIRLYGAITHTIASAEHFAELMAQSFGLSRERVWVTGQPRDDLMFLEHRRTRLRQALGLADRPLCVYMPTYRHAVIDDVRVDSTRAEPRIPLIEAELESLDAALDAAGWQLVIKLHPMDKLNERQWPAYRAVRVIPHREFHAVESDVYELVGIADRLVTDFSSVFVDYLALQRPVAFVHDADDRYTRGLTVKGDLEGFLPGPVLRTAQDFQDFVVEPDPEPARYRERAAQLQAFHDDRSGQRVMKRLLVAMDEQ
jgi:CDP-glycerol glycerophosphotransferase (TagB/SpsB family)